MRKEEKKKHRKKRKRQTLNKHNTITKTLEN